MTREHRELIEESELNSVLGEELPIIDRSSKKGGLDYKVSDFALPFVGFFNNFSRNAEKIALSNNCVCDSVYTVMLGAWHVGYGIALYSGISNLINLK